MSGAVSWFKSAVLDDVIGIDDDVPESAADVGKQLLAANADEAARAQRVALADRIKAEGNASLELARRPRVSGRGRRLLQYLDDGLASKFGG